MTHEHHRKMLLRLLPGMALPGIVYFVLARHFPTVVALAGASGLPVLHTLARLARGKRPNALALGFVAVAAVSIGLAMRLHSPMFILARGALISAVVGIAFAVSAAIGRPLTRWLALHISSEHPETRRGLRERWHHPRALSVFRTLATGWGLLLLVVALQQTLLILRLSPGTVMAVEPPVQGVTTALGIGASLLYVRRKQRLHPDLALLPTRSR